MVDSTQNIPTSRTRNSYNLEVKRLIVTEAFATPRNLRATARKFSIQPTQIRSWKRKFDENCEAATSTTQQQQDCITGTCTSNTAKRFKKNVGSRFGGGGRKCALQKDVIESLKKFFEGKRDDDLGVTLRLMMAECRILDPATCSLSMKALEGRVYRLLVKWNASWRRGTHKAQNTRHDIVVMNDFRSYVNMKAKLLGVDCRAVFNADETNVFYSMEGSYTYARRGSRTVAIKGVTSSDRCLFAEALYNSRTTANLSKQSTTFGSLD
jgi:transposase-like protein